MPTHPAGEALLKDARTLLPAADATRRRVRDVAAGQRTFTVGFMPGLIVTSAVRELSRRHPGLSVEVFRTDWTNQTGLLRDGPVDIGYLRLPADQYGLAIEPLFSEPRVVVLPADHRLAGKDAVTVADLAGEHLLQDPDAVPEWRDIAVELRGRQPRMAIPPLRTVEEKLEHVAAGGTGSSCSRCPPPRSTPAPTSATSPSATSRRTRCAFAWDSSRRRALIHEYAAIAGTLADHIASAWHQVNQNTVICATMHCAVARASPRSVHTRQQ